MSAFRGKADIEPDQQPSAVFLMSMACVRPVSGPLEKPHDGRIKRGGGDGGELVLVRLMPCRGTIAS
jgi:hypothetical protein